MSWFNFGGKTGSNTQKIPVTTPLQQQRLKQIKSLTNHNQNVTEINRDVEYKVTFQSSNKTFALNILLPENFPNEKPTITLSPSSYHPWVDSATNEVLGSQALNSFYMHSDLGKIVQQIVKEMKKSSPVIKEFEVTPLAPGFNLPYQSPTPNVIRSTAMTPPERPPNYVRPRRAEETGDSDLDKILHELSMMPKSELEKIYADPDILFDIIASTQRFDMDSDIGKIVQQIVIDMKNSNPAINMRNTAMTSSERPPSYGRPHKVEETGDHDVDKLLQELSAMPKSELEKICIDPDVLIDRIASMQSVEKLKEDRRKRIEENEEIARATLELEPVIDDLKGDLKESFERYNELFYEFQDKSRKQDELAQFYDVGNILTNLRISAMQSEEESEKIAEDFVSGSTSLDTFLTDFIYQRKQTHLRRVKEERIKHLAPY